ncbi:NAD(P)-dependent oxidoreductase [candidate division WOR-3 bacterium]|nr:NAD(P)-dependent oxidoreductase [candidate division WOR-3 bacterium]
MNILVAGANGYLGGRISEYLADSGHSVSALVHHRLNNAVEWEKKMDSIIEGNAVDKDVLVSALKKGIDTIIYTISFDHNESGKDPFKTLAVNVGILWQLMDIYSKNGGGKIIYLSTQQVYGRFKLGVTLFEDSPVVPANSYGLTHKYCEDLCSFYSREKNMETICLRISNGFGAPLFPSCNCWWLVIMDLCKTAFKKGEIRLLSDGSPQRDFIRIDDICRAISLLADDQNEKAKQIAEKVRKYYPDCKITISKKDAGDTRDYNVSFDKLNKVLGFKCSWTLKDGIEELRTEYDNVMLDKEKFEHRYYTRLKQVEHLMQNNIIDKSLRRM